MARILTIFSGSMGHYKGLARFFEANKIPHQFIFASNDQKAGKTISDFYWIASQPAYMNNEFLMNISQFEKLQLKIDNVLFTRRQKGIAQLIELTKPDVVLLDNFNFTDALIIRDLDQFSNLKIILYQTRLSTALSSTTIYGGLEKQEFKMLKGKRIVKKQNNKRKLEKVLMPGFSDEYRIKKMIRKFNFRNVKLDKNRSGPPSLAYLPELIMSNQSLSYYKTANQRYMGLGISVDDVNFKNSKYKNILVSIGSREFIFDFTNNYVETIRDLSVTYKNLTFFVPQSFEAKVIGRNVEYYTWNSYNQVLPQANLHITHGGINSIKDSLMNAIPMLICPMDWKSDQIHNALIFERLGMAEVWHLLEDNMESVQSKLQGLMKTDKREVIIEFVQQNANENSPEKIRSLFDELIHDEKWEVRNW